MKNFKKVISAVVALAMSVSSLVAVNASSFTDVADTAAYAEAVDVLSALGIVTGYEDGTFKPEGTITRAEAATMIVGALNMTEDAKASAGTSQFDDVNTSASWASGYINVGVNQGFIAGMDANTFAPQENVTYAQMCVMLTSIAGYGEYAAANNAGSSDWSYGYTTMAASTGINKGVSVSKDTALTRGQVAQMIYNTLTTPKLGVAEYSLTGNTYSQLDGKSGREFKTLLSEKFDGYVVTATIKATPTSGDLENGKVTIDITKADYWDGTDSAISTTPVSETINFADTIDVNANLFQSGKAIIVIDELDEYNMIFFSANTRTETKEFAASDYVMSTDLGSTSKFSAPDPNGGKIRFDSKSYTMADRITLYVNGAETIEFTKSTPNVDTDVLDKYLGSAEGTIKLVKGSDDKGYSKIFVNCYEIAKVTSVSYKNNQTVINYTPKTNLMPATKLVVDDDQVEDGDVVITVKNGDADIELKDLAKDDIIAIATDFTKVTGSNFSNPNEITVLVSRDTVSGKVTGKDDDEKTFTIDGKAYECVAWSSSFLNIKDSYTLTLDPFGRIYSAEEDATSKKYAIVEKYNSSSETVQLVLADGTMKNYEFESSVTVDDIKGILFVNGESEPKKAPQERVVEYTIKNSTGTISALTAVTPKYSYASGSEAEYKARTEKLGSASINSATQIVDATEYIESGSTGKASDYATFGVSSLTDGTTYGAYVYQPSGSTYASFVLLTKIGTVFNESSRFAVVRKAPQADTHNDDDCYRVNVLYNGEETDLYFLYTDALRDSVDVGDAFFFETDSDGFIKATYVVYDHNENTLDTNFKTFAQAGVPVDKYKHEASDRDGWRFSLYDDNHDIALVYGIVTEAERGVEFSPALNKLTDATKIDTNFEDDTTDSKGIYNFALSNDAHVYTYDIGDTLTVKEADKIGVGSVIASNIDRFETDTNTGIYTVNAESKAEFNYALALVVDGTIVEIYEIIRQ